jgi:hypothetical protein
MKHARVSFVALSALALAAVPARADPIRFDFAATITHDVTYLGDPIPGLEVGGLITGFLVFESSTPNTHALPDHGSYDSVGPDGLYTLSVAAYTFSVPRVVVYTDPDPLTNGVAWDAYTAGTVPSGIDSAPYVAWSLRTVTGNDVLDSVALPLVPPPGPWSLSVGFYDADREMQAALIADVTSLEVAPAAVPEPGSLALLTMGLATAATRGLWTRKRRRSLQNHTT